MSDLAIARIVKAAAPKQFTLGLAYPAMKADVGKGLDGRRDFIGEDALEETAWRWMAKSRQVGLYHRDGTEGHGTVVESYIYRGPDWVIEAADGSSQTIVKGDWLLGNLWDDLAWAAIEAGLIGGLSPQGTGKRGYPAAERLLQLRNG